MALKRKNETWDAGRPKINTVVEDGEARLGNEPLPPRTPPPVEEKTVTKPEPTVRTGLLKVTARQYVQARGIRWERAAGFLHWAAQQHGAGHLLTVPEWTNVQAGFDATPVGRV